jgi:chromosome segregation ATPase
LEQQLADCTGQRELEQQLIQQVKEENIGLGRELARVEGELKRCQEERSRHSGDEAEEIPRAEDQAAQARETDPDELVRETRLRQKLQGDLELRLAELDGLRRELRAREEELDQLRSENTEHRAEIRELRRQTQELERRIATCEESLNEREMQLARLERPDETA